LLGFLTSSALDITWSSLFGYSRVTWPSAARAKRDAITGVSSFFMVSGCDWGRRDLVNPTAKVRLWVLPRTG